MGVCGYTQIFLFVCFLNSTTSSNQSDLRVKKVAPTITPNTYLQQLLGFQSKSLYMTFIFVRYHGTMCYGKRFQAATPPKSLMKYAPGYGPYKNYFQNEKKKLKL